jgi:hypothetical protein
LINEKGEHVSDQLPVLPENAVVILAMDHDHPALDARYINLVAKKLGIDRSVLLTDKEAWPHYEYHKNKDENVFFIQDKEFKGKVLDILESHPNGRAAFMIFPEGGLPFWGTQFPLISQWGAFSMARKAAHRMAGKKPVYFIEINGNFLPSVTNSDKVVPIKLRVTEPVLVPTTPVGQRDPWVEEMRSKFEEHLNEVGERGRQYDLIDRRPVKDARIRRVDDVREYRKAPEVFKKLMQLKENKCGQAVSDAG